MPVVESFWEFTPTGDGFNKVVFQGYGDPGGHASSGFMRWMHNRLVWQVPYKTIRGMQVTIDKTEYQTASFGFVQEPEFQHTE